MAACLLRAPRPHNIGGRAGARRWISREVAGPAAGLALDVESAFVGLGDGVADRQAQAGGAGLAGAGRVDSIEPLEDARQVFGRDPDAGVLDEQLGLALVVLQADADEPPRGSVFDGVVDQIEQQPAELVAVAADDAGGQRVDQNKLLAGDFGRGPRVLGHAACQNVQPQPLEGGRRAGVLAAEK